MRLPLIIERVTLSSICQVFMKYAKQFWQPLSLINSFSKPVSTNGDAFSLQGVPNLFHPADSLMEKKSLFKKSNESLSVLFLNKFYFVLWTFLSGTHVPIALPSLYSYRPLWGSRYLHMTQRFQKKIKDSNVKLR